MTADSAVNSAYKEISNSRTNKWWRISGSHKFCAPFTTETRNVLLVVTTRVLLSNLGRIWNYRCSVKGRLWWTIRFNPFHCYLATQHHYHQSNIIIPLNGSKSTPSSCFTVKRHWLMTSITAVTFWQRMVWCGKHAYHKKPSQ